jgi:Uma2 family endonuclease
MAMPNAVTEWTVDMLDALPDDGQRYEVIDGALYVTPAPSEQHQVVAGHLYSLLKAYLKASSVGRPMISPADVRKGDRARNRVQPDVFVLRLREGNRPAYPYDLDDLLLAVEVVSPSNPALDYQVKRELYLRNGVSEYWVIDPDARNVSRWRNSVDSGDVLSERVEWHPAGMPTPFVVDLATFFEEAFE